MKNILKNYYCDVCNNTFSLKDNCFYRYNQNLKIISKCYYNFNNKEIINVNNYKLLNIPSNKKPRRFIICKYCFYKFLFYKVYEI